MRQQVLKALANPARIFYVPYFLAVLNFFVFFSIYMTVFVVMIIVDFYNIPSPLYLLTAVGVTHFILMGMSKREPQLANIISAKIQMFKRKIPNNLIV